MPQKYKIKQYVATFFSKIRKKIKNHSFFVSTHDIELADLLKTTYDLYHFTEVIKEEQIHFDYKLKRGNLSSKNAIRILEINNYPSQVVEEAREIRKKMKNF